jgi:hypothetical protein
MVFVTADPDTFVQQWERPARPGNLPQATTIAKVQRGQTLAALNLFSGCTADPTGNCDATADFHLAKPDGSDYARHKGWP